MEYRIEELARRAGTGVDTIRFYQGRGLLPPPRRQGRVTWYGDGHVQRMRRIRELQERGFSLAVIRRFLTGELEPSDEALVAAVAAPTGDATALTADELAQRSGVPLPLLLTLRETGLLNPLPGDPPRYPGSDVELLAVGLRVLEAGIPLAELLRLGEGFAQASDHLARAAVECFDRYVREPIQRAGDGQEATAARLTEAFDALLAASTTLVSRTFTRRLLALARARAEGLGEAAPGNLAASV
ncbi:MAG TPA: MerR family transcriptional regulator [Candidatus Micrarchaeia archaeon]|nr:MerR family transcriptional regulator [Candidatus Micrarchaeia archaeon]